jgi:hypothetical protein
MDISRLADILGRRRRHVWLSPLSRIFFRRRRLAGENIRRLPGLIVTENTETAPVTLVTFRVSSLSLQTSDSSSFQISSTCKIVYPSSYCAAFSYFNVLIYYAYRTRITSVQTNRRDVIRIRHDFLFNAYTVNYLVQFPSRERNIIC